MGLFGNSRRRAIIGLQDEVAQLQAELQAEREELAHLRRLLAMKEEETEALSKRCAHMERRCLEADELEAQMEEIEKKVSEFVQIKESYDNRLRKLKMERDEARSLLKARDSLDDTISPIDFSTRAISLPGLDDDTEHCITSEAAKSKVATREEREIGTVDWYEPLPE